MGDVGLPGRSSARHTRGSPGRLLAGLCLLALIARDLRPPLLGSTWRAFLGPPSPRAGPARRPPPAGSAAHGHTTARAEPTDVAVEASANPELKTKQQTTEDVASTVTPTKAAVGAAATAAVLAQQQRSATQTLVFGVLAALAFCGYVLYDRGAVSATQWLSCYVIEYSLSIDNLFVFIVIFKYFKVPPKLQDQVLNYGIIGAIVFRFVFVYLGAIVLQEFEFLILAFAAILIYASYTNMTKGEEDDDDDEDLENNFIVMNLRKVLDVSPRLDGEKFFTEVDGKSMITPLFLCLLTIEFSDIVFATDSVPAVLGTTQDQFIAYTSNIFAVFGLRSLYFLLQEAIVSFSKLESAVNFVLGFIGVKIILDFFDIVDIDVLISLFIVLGTLATGVILSIAEMGEENKSEADEET